MLQDAILSIRRADDQALRRRSAVLSRRRPIRLLDHWVSLVETLVERDEPVVPEPLIDQITGFIGELDPLLCRKLKKNGTQDSVQVLDVLFEAEEQFLPTRLIADDVVETPPQLGAGKVSGSGQPELLTLLRPVSEREGKR
jgi:hypothetical protein